MTEFFSWDNSEISFKLYHLRRTTLVARRTWTGMLTYILIILNILFVAEIRISLQINELRVKFDRLIEGG